MKYLSFVAYVLMMSLGLVTANQAVAKDVIGYAVDSSGKFVMDNYGYCVRTGSWSQKHAIASCEGGIDDKDGDGVADDKDKCPDTPANVKVDDTGCPLDSDGDGVADYQDKCAGTPAGATVDANGCPQDSDGDGVADYLDKCPGTPAGAPVDANGCPKDTDGDGIADYLDKCPGTAKGTKVDNKGCELKERIQLRGVNFANNSAKLTAASSAVLDDMVRTLKRYPDQKVEVAGHTDGSGTRSYNLSLSKKRAESVRKYLIDNGVAAGNLTARGYGPDSPIASNKTREGRAKNRRVELRLK
jgi:OOP family OmpA-OmpF porin